MNQIDLGTFTGGSEDGASIDLRDIRGTRGLGMQLWAMGTLSAGSWKLEVDLDSSFPNAEQGYGTAITPTGAPPDGAATSLTGVTDTDVAYMIMGPFGPFVRIKMTSFTGSMTFTLVFS